MIDFTHFKSVISVVNHFNNEDVCKQTLIDIRWGDDVVCPPLRTAPLRKTY